MRVITGKWGCGAFRGEEDLKFVIQWLAASEASREMVYISDSREKLEEYRLLVRELALNNTLDLLSFLDEYQRMRIKTKELSLLDYLKQFA
jgi:poly(ADP-ribose) glycohydrolase